MIWQTKAPFLSLNLHSLAEQLTKVDLSQRLFVEEDLLSPELMSVCQIMLNISPILVNLRFWIVPVNVGGFWGTLNLKIFTPVPNALKGLTAMGFFGN
ncbi:hypothetical protein CK203_015392 [Vitis vinifera]|uniref:Uncharacterized protein n=1 Tax=Vitis vinifera TaxID=29760 RepID=A0A438JJZ0_VITVI|nr:hypothetical protein CK203_015392 [Vitis vinifera]